MEGEGTETSSLPISDSVDARRDGVVVPPSTTGKRRHAAIGEVEGKELVGKKGGDGEISGGGAGGRETVPTCTKRIREGSEKEKE